MPDPAIAGAGVRGQDQERRVVVDPVAVDPEELERDAFGESEEDRLVAVIGDVLVVGVAKGRGAELRERASLVVPTVESEFLLDGPGAVERRERVEPSAVGPRGWKTGVGGEFPAW